MNSGMNAKAAGFAEEASRGMQDDLGRRISDPLLEQLNLISADAVAIFRYSGAPPTATVSATWS
jgi:hypothetical protein